MNHPDDASHALLFSWPHTSDAETILASVAIASAARTMDRARRGDEALRPRRSSHLLPAELLHVPDLEATLAAAGVGADTIPTLAAVVRRDARHCADAARWVAVTDTTGVAPDQHDLLRVFGAIAIDAATALDPPRVLGCLRTVMLLGPAPPSDDATAPSALLLAAQLDVPGLFDLHVFESLLATEDRVRAHAPRVRPWLAPGAGPAVRVHAPEDHPGVPFAFIPLVIPDAATHRALAADGVLDQLVGSVELAFEPRVH